MNQPARMTTTERVRKYRQQLPAIGARRFEVTIDADLASKARDYAARHDVPVWQIVELALERLLGVAK